MEQRSYDLLGAGRYKIIRKLQITSRLFGRVLARDVKDNSGKIILSQGTLILKNELDALKDAFIKNNIDVISSMTVNSKLKIFNGQSKEIESIAIYTDNNERNEVVEVIAPHTESTSRSLTITDFVSIVSYISGLPYDIGQIDDIEHLGNKRLRLIHEQLRTKLNAGLAKVEKHIKDKLSSLAIPTANEEQQNKLTARTTIKNVVNTKQFSMAIKNFFNSYQLTNFTDQQNPLSELSSKRKISAMGEGGISREDPNLEVRDIHHTHYGRICPIEAPEGQNVGLIMSLTAFAKVDDNGFIVSPYRKVENGVITNKIEYMTALKEDEYIICEATVPQKDGKIEWFLWQT
jgi:DNA-directed RNA polymerase subunit beta